MIAGLSAGCAAGIAVGVIAGLDQMISLAAGKAVGLGCAMKNAGVGVGIPDWGRVKLIVEDDAKLHIYTGASCIGQ